MFLDNIQVADIRPSPIHGLGLFASEPIAAGMKLCFLDGQKVPWEVFQAYTPPAAAPFVEWNALSPTTLLVRYVRTKYSFINHSRQPNCLLCKLAGRLHIEAIRHIPVGEELTLDYRREPLPAEYLAGHGASYL